MPAITERQFQILEHALGLPNTSGHARLRLQHVEDCYRNNYVAVHDTDRAADCFALVDAGLMRGREVSGVPIRSHIFHVTEAGFDALIDAGRVSNQRELFARRGTNG